ncbi:Glycine cleavage H-protein, subgroup domain-containing protein [Rozella allomycis CSF55]|uniref:Glycine cleavage system H protein n=1 Tax=Rozella allomycis (strain CSF55) TaxID=988480 RepID=A0A075B0U4_ROZAC|nr:Glycine cleavage H-protein, subgroup domain-containing protein [Rozella allomycis CSF55]|eukprot:EPZ34451.1 Glycine cleavage H-protein, subgroup domain-containing protein [Rozella allomycis CSF55]
MWMNRFYQLNDIRNMRTIGRYLSTMLYTREHEWLQMLENNEAKIGITSYAQKALGDVVYVEIYSGKTVKQKESIGAVESVKAASDIYSPADGTIIEVNEKVVESPKLINDSPENEGWLCKLKVDPNFDSKMLMNEADYAKYCKGAKE